MKKINCTTTLTQFDSIDDLPHEAKSLMLEAIEIRKKAYAPYSRFRVGAAVLIDNGDVVVGSNQENAAYPSGMCAERVAIFSAGARYPDNRILKLALSASSDHQVINTPVPPCGACRQAISEYEQRQKSPIEIYFMGHEGAVYMTDSIADLLPFSFGSEFLQ